MPKFEHNTFEVKRENITASCDKNGKLTIKVDDAKTDEFEQVTVPASFIYMVANMLKATARIVKTGGYDYDGTRD